MDPARLAEIKSWFKTMEWDKYDTTINRPTFDQAKRYGEELSTAIEAAWRERDGDLVGTSNCPVCGKNTPHHHSAEPAERGDLLPTIKHALNELQMSGESSRLASNEIYPYAIGWLWYLVKRAARAEAEVERLKEDVAGWYRTCEECDRKIIRLQAVREAAEACDSDLRNALQNVRFAELIPSKTRYENLRRALDAAQDPAR